MNLPVNVQKAFELAQIGLKNSYAPYSKLHVSSVFADRDGNFYPGVNVENASYGGTICAERSAIVSAVSQRGRCQFEFAVVLSDIASGGPIPPCGLCLQVINEFVGPDFVVYLGGPEGIARQTTLGELLPQAFSWGGPNP